jgi:RNA polymerase sigma-70 factor (ECF subfamily)
MEDGRGLGANASDGTVAVARTRNAGNFPHRVPIVDGVTVDVESGKRARFLELVMPHLEALHRTAFYMTRRRELAEDSVQEAYMRAWRSFHTLDEGRSVRVWLLAILRNVIFDAARKRKREPAGPSFEDVGPESVAAPGLAPDERLADKDILAAMDGLPEDLRAVVLLAIVEDMKYREIAEALDIPIGTVMSRLHRGRQLLRWKLRGYVDGVDVEVA